MKFGRFFPEILNIGKFRRGVHTEIYGVFKVKKPKELSIGKCKM